MNKVIIILLITLQGLCVQAQTSDIYIPANSTVGFFTTDTTAIFGNIKIDGTIILPTRSFVYFMGETWRNATANNIIDESLNGASAIGGTVRFTQISRPGTIPIQQKIFGSYTAASQTGTYFPNFQLDNASGLMVNDSSDIAIRNNLHFINGKIIISRANVVIGSPSRRGSITGFNENNYIVTGGSLFGGFLYRLRILPDESDSTVFPIGTSANSYTPFSMINHGEADDFRARVFSRVLEHGLFGINISDQSTNKTWIVANTKPIFNASIRFQHIIEDEGTAFSAGRKYSYVSHLNSAGWDTTGVFSTPKSPGTITTGQKLNNSATLTRTFRLSQPESFLFAEFVRSYGVDNPVNTFNFTAKRISPILALLNITVNNDNNVMYYEIQKRRLNVTNWEAVDTLMPANINGNHTYSWYDNDVYYTDIIQYRIRIIAPDGTYTYSVIRNIDGIAPDFFVQVFPNPGYDQFYLRLVNAPDVENMVVYDNYGQFLFSKVITNSLTPFNLGTYPQGNYYVVLYGKGKRKIMTEKVIKLNR
ncbi:Por secretion system C-terminal sorting domain-containing protein [Filimonas lacunae]|uniref:Por secretion system C-terminal sorting domain-containing protein n=1 Tax=Filimonas lacunae TaxID=477680 RepID=A0A173MQ08_9BACT|nr:T9SS type A sorting domain-containing protein [Filimonas lacunae]BAV09742.1 hypothetical protein FLA_5795 [Filimonas lacunae]SIS78250.1 Por secretion system C-terminal sorting domain-containing protein [Filimonas lacunae]